MPMASSTYTGSNRSPSAATRIVGIGASAGGLEPLEQFLAHVPPKSGLAYVVVQHLDPTQKALLAELLQRVTDNAGARSQYEYSRRARLRVCDPSEYGAQRGQRRTEAGEARRATRLEVTDQRLCSLHWRAPTANAQLRWFYQAWDRTARWACRPSRQWAA